MGCREFPAYFELKEVGEEVRKPEAYSQDAGFMLYDVFDLRRPGLPLMEGEKPFISLFHARIESGVLTVPDFETPDVLKPEPEAAHA
jgi:CRISPR-associated protein Cas5d